VSDFNVELEGRLRVLSSAFKDSIDPPATLHGGVITRTAGRPIRRRPALVRELSLAVALIVFVALIAFTFSKLHPLTVAPVKPSPSPSAAAVVYFQRPAVAGWQVIDWMGKLHGSVGSDRVGIPYQSPDGSRLLWSPEGVWQIVDKSGRLQSLPDLSRSIGFTWADDSSGVCALNALSDNPPNGGSYQLAFISATGGSRTIASLTTQKSPDVAVCSPAAGRVVITTASGYKDPSTMLMRITFGELRVLDFKSGSVVFQQAFPVGNVRAEVNSVVVAHDGSLAALATQTQTTILNLSDGQIVGRTADETPLAFSWDGKLLALDASSNRGEVMKLSTGQVVWSDSVANRVTQGAVPNPAGSDVMLLVTGGGLNDLLVVSAGGTANVIAKDVFPDRLAPCTDCSAF
jgi:outer membrane protein assembly factor BamB